MAGQTDKKKYRKQAFIDAASTRKERLILKVVLDESKQYTTDDVKNIVKEWKQKEVK